MLHCARMFYERVPFIPQQLDDDDTSLSIAKLIYNIVRALLPNLISDHRDEINQHARYLSTKTKFSFLRERTHDKIYLQAIFILIFVLIMEFVEIVALDGFSLRRVLLVLILNKVSTPV